MADMPERQFVRYLTQMAMRCSVKVKRKFNMHFFQKLLKSHHNNVL